MFMNKQCKIVVVAMFKNEASVLLDMLESCKPYVDFYVLQNNGSTDGSDQIAKDFLINNNLSGVVYEEEWKGFGWNRDQLLQYCQSIDHGCDWILQMDCDELLEVDPTFDWTIFNDFTIHAFHIPVTANDCVYFRNWCWNAKLSWRFNHDVVHETVYCENIKNIVIKNLPNRKFQHIRLNIGETWSNPTKFISQALLLEEDLIKNKTLLSDTHHFWNLGHCYNDAYNSPDFPLGLDHQKEFARRTIFYFQEYVNFIHNFRETGVPKHIDEDSYCALMAIAHAYRFLGELDTGIMTAKLAEPFAPKRNDHLWFLTNVYYDQKRYDDALKSINEMVTPGRTNPFPEYIQCIDSTLYIDSNSTKLKDFQKKILDEINKGEKKYYEQHE